jgi:hypothetical protein
MASTRHDLLQPSLAAGSAAARPPYSDTASFVASFFGGPIAALGMFTMSSWRLDRLRRDAPLVLAGLIVYALWFVLWHGQGEASEMLAASLAMLGSNGPALALRLIGLGLFAAGAALHRRERRSAELFGLARPKPWLVVVAWIVVGNVADAFALGRLP